MKSPRGTYRLAISLALTFLLSGLGFAAYGAQGRHGLTMTQLEELIHIHTPDNVVAAEIRSHGLDFTPTPKILEDLHRRGAGPSTLAAVRERMPIGTLEVDAVAGSEVTLDGTVRGTTNPQGRLVIPDLPAGPHQLLVTRPKYESGEFNFTLAAHEYKRFPVRLMWAGGYLTVQVDRPGSTIQIAGLGQYNQAVSDLPCPAGSYNITVMHPQMKTEFRSVMVSAGQHASVEIHMVADPEWVASILGNAAALRSGGDIDAAVQKANEVLQVDPSNRAAHSSIYDSYLAGGSLALRTSNWSNAFNYLHAAANFDPTKPGAWGGLGSVDLVLGRTADMASAWNNDIRLGGFVEFGVWHQLGLGCENGRFRITSTQISFVDRRGVRVFAVPPSQVRVIGVYTFQNQSYFRLRVGRRNYNFNFIPFGVACQVLMVVQCPPRGIEQERTVANYVTQAIRMLASGALSSSPMGQPSSIP